MHGIHGTDDPHGKDAEGVSTGTQRTYPELFKRSDCLYGLISFINPLPFAFLGHSLFLMSLVVDYDFRWLFLALLFTHYILFNVYPFFRIKHISVPADPTSNGIPWIQCGDVLFIALFFIPIVNLFWWMLVTFCVAEKVRRLHSRFVTGDPVTPALNRRSIVTIAIWIFILLCFPYCISILCSRFSLPSTPRYELHYTYIRWLIAPLFAAFTLDLISVFIAKKDRMTFTAVASFSYLAITPALFVLAHFFYPGEYETAIVLASWLNFYPTLDHVNKKIKALYNRLGYGE